MSDRKRVNISIDPATYGKLQALAEQYKFKNICELLVSFAHILLDRMEVAEQRKYDLPDEDGAYIDTMFDELGEADRKPYDTNVCSYTHKKIKGNGKGQRV